MAGAVRRYPLILYTRMLDRWWPAVMLLGAALLGLAWPLYRDPLLRLEDPWRWQTMVVLGGLVILAALVMIVFRRSGYVELLGDHLKVATPFLRMNVSYRRIRQATTASMSGMFPPKSISGWRREIIEPLGHMTAVVIELNAFPMPPSALRFFLSPFFFKDRTPHLVILVQDWMGFSTTLESLRVNGGESGSGPASASLLSHLPKK